jgi:cell division initiation protein
VTNEGMSVTPRNIREHEFCVGPSGYDRDEVRSFLARVAEDYELALDLAGDFRAPILDEHPGVPDNVRKKSDELIRQAKEEARRIRQEAAAQAAEIREQAAEERLDLRELARDRAGHLLAEAKESMAEVAEARDQVAQMRSGGTERTTITLNDAYDRAADILETAEANALGLIRKSQADYRARLDEVSQQLAEFELHEERLRRRILVMEGLVDKIHAYTSLLRRINTGDEGQELVDQGK